MNALSKELCHYGVIGMHWGVRRYQPYSKDYNGSGKFVGKVKISSEDKTKRFKAIRRATLSGINRSSTKEKYQEAKERKSENRSQLKKEYDFWNKEYKKREKEAKELVKELSDKYGKENVKSIPYKDGTVSGQVFTRKELITRGVLSAILVAGGPIIPGPSAAMAIMVMPSKKTAALNYKVKRQRAEGLPMRTTTEKTINKIQQAIKTQV